MAKRRCVETHEGDAQKGDKGSGPRDCSPALATRPLDAALLGGKTCVRTEIIHSST